MKIRNHVYLKDLEKFGYTYEKNLLFPTYRKVIHVGNNDIIIEILEKSREIFVNKSKHIKNIQLRYLEELERENLIEK